MQLGLIVGILFAIVAAVFAMQNIGPVVVTFGFWSFEGSLAVVLLVTLGLGALIAGLVSSPAMIRRQWHNARQGRYLSDLERRLAEESRCNDELRAELAQLRATSGVEIATETVPPEAGEKPYLSLRALMAADSIDKKPG